MAQTFALIVGIEKYQDSHLQDVPYAEADARAMSEALEAIGCPIANQTVLINERATKTAIESDLGLTVAGLSPEDRCFIFFAGHGFFDGSFNMLAAHDSRHRDLHGTAVRLQAVLAIMKASGCEQNVLFLDACHTGIVVEQSMRSSISGARLEKEDAGAYFAGFASCSADEKSYSSITLKHGIWTYHLLQALRGDEKSVLTGTELDATKLQQFLLARTKETLLATYENRVKQTPRFFGSYNGIPKIADLETVLADRAKQRAAKGLKLKDVAIVGNRSFSVTSYNGFDRKRHFVPEVVTRSATSWVQSLAQDDLNEHVKKIVAGLRDVMDLKIKYTKPVLDNGAASFRLPSFDYNVRIGQDPEEPSEVLWRHELSNIVDRDELQGDEFNAVFGKLFDTVEFRYEGTSPEIGELAEALEEEESVEKVTLPTHEHFVEFTLPESDLTIRVTPGSFEFAAPRTMAPDELMEAFDDSRIMLASVECLAPLLRPKPKKLPKPPQRGALPAPPAKKPKKP